MYDTIVLGNDPGSLVAAVTLANQGRKTLLLAENTPQCYSESGYTFDTVPLPWSGFNRGNVFKQFLSHLGIPHQEESPLNPKLQIIFQRHRVELCGTTEWDVKEIEREFPNGTSETRSFYTSLTKSGSFASSLIDKGLHLRPETVKDHIRLLLNAPLIILKKRAFTANLKTIRQQPSIGKILEAQILLLSHLDPRAISPISFARTLSAALQGLSYYREGRHLLITRLKKKFEADGGVIDEHPISTLDMERVVKVNVKTDDDAIPTIYGRNIIISTYYEGLASLLGENKELSSVRKRYNRRQPSLYPFTLHMGVNGRCIPEKMGTYVVVVPDETKTVEDGNLLFLEASEPGNSLRAPEGKRAISVTAFLKKSPSESDNNVLKKVVDTMLKNLGFFLPFLEENIDFINPEESINISREYRKTVGPKYGVKNPLIGMSFLSNKTPMKNVFLTGDTLIPGLGFEGEIISGINAARLATGRE